MLRIIELKTSALFIRHGGTPVEIPQDVRKFFEKITRKKHRASQLVREVGPSATFGVARRVWIRTKKKMSNLYSKFRLDPP